MGESKLGRPLKTHYMLSPRFSFHAEALIKSGYTLDCIVVEAIYNRLFIPLRDSAFLISNELLNQHYPISKRQANG